MDQEDAGAPVHDGDHPGEQLFSEGIEAVEEEDLKRAASLFKAALAAGLSERDAILCRAELGYCYLGTDREDEGEALVEQALRDDQKGGHGFFELRDLRVPIFRLLEMRWMIRGSELYQQRRYAEQLEFARSKLALVSHISGEHLPLILFLASGAAYHLGDHDAWQGWLKRVLRAEIPSLDENDPARQQGLEIQREARRQLASAVRGSGPAPAQSQCWIATAVYGSGSDEVAVLREFRDAVLLPSRSGRIFVAVYYLTAPGTAKLIKRFRFLRRIADRWLLRGVVSWVKSRLHRQGF